MRAPGLFVEFDATLLFKIGATGEGAGFLFGHADDGHRVVSYDPRESTWRLASYEGGEVRETGQAPAPEEEVQGASGTWVGLRVLLEGGRLQAWQNSVLVLDVADMGVPRAGEMGFFVGRSTTAAFDDLRVEPLTR